MSRQIDSRAVAESFATLQRQMREQVAPALRSLANSLNGVSRNMRDVIDTHRQPRS
ncbi:hypothetical protein ACLQ2R_03265 [Streptosporangium sp. DT93]|uniref:hypothetical protein n=1 Tax=Streptosporangium sp. DT93 TaxID=3393428 RepID=UPI003CE76DF5